MNKYVYVKLLSNKDRAVYIFGDDEISNMLIFGNIYNVVLKPGFYEISEGDTFIGYLSDKHSDCFISLADWRNKQINEILNG